MKEVLTGGSERPMPAIRFLIRGRVQGVGFRDFSRRVARELGLRGWVRNRSDGTVEVLAEGEEDALETLRQELRRGPSRALVHEVEESAGPGHAVGATFEIL